MTSHSSLIWVFAAVVGIVRFALPPVLTAYAWIVWQRPLTQLQLPAGRRRLALLSLLLCTLTLIPWVIGLLVPALPVARGGPFLQPLWMGRVTVFALFAIVVSMVCAGFAKGKLRDALLSAGFAQLFVAFLN